MRGRIATQYWAAKDWLESILVEGPAAAKHLKQTAYVGWRTIVKVKKELGVKSIHTQNGWIWYMPSINPELDQAGATLPEVQGLFAPGEEPEGDNPIKTSEMLITAKFLHVTRLEDENFIIRQLVQDCKKYPQTPPYPKEYIKALVHHVVCGQALPALPPGNIE